MLSIEMIKKIQKIHENQFIHRDIKPDNFMIGRDKKAAEVYLIDLGLAKRYIDPKNGKHI